jgi:hypothetical protein
MSETKFEAKMELSRVQSTLGISQERRDTGYNIRESGGSKKMLKTNNISGKRTVHYKKTSSVPQKKESKMVKSINAKFLRPLLLLICFALFCCLSGCGNGESTSTSTSTGTSTSTSLSMTVAPTPESVYSGQQSIVIATVKNADGTAASGQTVTFSFAGGAATGLSGATISTINSGLTNASGEAWATYTGGSLNDSTDIIDVVQAEVSGTVALTTITRSMTNSVSGGYSIISFEGIPATSWSSRFSTFGVANCELKATVSSGFSSASGVAGIPVTFTIFRGLGTLPTVTTIVTDTNGEAWIFFDLPVPGAGNETIVRATVPLLAPQTNGGDAVSIIYW